MLTRRLPGPSGPVKLAKKEPAAKPAPKVSLSFSEPTLYFNGSLLSSVGEEDDHQGRCSQEGHR